jgi:hypothetical protein
MTTLSNPKAVGRVRGKGLMGAVELVAEAFLGFGDKEGGDRGQLGFGWPDEWCVYESNDRGPSLIQECGETHET